MIEESEIKLCLQMELHKNPLISAEELADSFEMRHYAASSGPSPSLRIHKDHSSLLRVMQLDSNGPARLLTYLSARLFYEALMNQRDIDSTSVRMHKMQFMLDMQSRIAELPANWHESLTEKDEEISDGSIFSGLAAALAKPTNVDDSTAEGKAAQRCLESLLRLDAIHNLRSTLYDNNLKVRVAIFRESDWDFSGYISLLNQIEQDNIVRLHGKSTPQGNSQTLTSLIASIGTQTKRMSPNMKRFLDNLEGTIDETEASNKQGVRVAGSTLLALVNETLAAGGNVSREDIKRLDSVRNQLQRDLDSVSYSDGRLRHLHSVYGRQGERLGKARVIHGDMVTKRLYESYVDKGLPVPVAVKARLEAGIKAGTIKPKAIKARAPAKPLTGIKLSISNVLDDAIANGMFGSLVKKESK